jgi:hypothetical protein
VAEAEDGPVGFDAWSLSMAARIVRPPAPPRLVKIAVAGDLVKMS